MPRRRKMGTKLSHELLDAGFFSALGTTENAGGNKTLVKKGEPLTYDDNNGVFVIYDENGRPWIKRATDAIDDLHRFRGKLRRGGYVPHSNDGGYFTREVIPQL